MVWWKKKSNAGGCNRNDGLQAILPKGISPYTLFVLNDTSPGKDQPKVRTGSVVTESCLESSDIAFRCILFFSLHDAINNGDHCKNSRINVNELIHLPDDILKIEASTGGLTKNCLIYTSDTSPVFEMSFSFLLVVNPPVVK